MELEELKQSWKSLKAKMDICSFESFVQSCRNRFVRCEYLAYNMKINRRRRSSLLEKSEPNEQSQQESRSVSREVSKSISWIDQATSQTIPDEPREEIVNTSTSSKDFADWLAPVGMDGLLSELEYGESIICHDDINLDLSASLTAAHTAARRVAVIGQHRVH
eukprot:751126-Hanusia_phi.AAC.3